MSDSKLMTLRVQSPEGTARVQVREDESLAALFERVRAALRLRGGAFALHRDRARRDELAAGKVQRLRDAGLRHGDMIFLSAINGARLFDQPSTSTEANSTSAEVSSQPSASAADAAGAGALEEDEVDLELYQMDGSIHRERDDKLCRHGPRGRCVHCAPLEPWDEEHLKAHNIKHLSFHAFLRKSTAGNFASLQELSFKIKPGCKEHPPWPRGICSSCQPGAVTLSRQPYRHVDNVLVEHPALVERFLGYWRATGHQRLGWLYGRYERHPDVPLGVRARVAAIYEPAQTSSRDGIALQPDGKDAAVEELARRLGLRRVGWLFTDLLPAAGGAPGAVQHLRGVESHFLSAQECIMAAQLQNQHPNACRHAASGQYGSKFVTVCLTGDAQQQVHMEGYQVSAQCAALVRDALLLPTRDAPDLGYVRAASRDQYVPDVYYKERDAYGNDVSVAATRLPVAYLLVDVPCGVSAPAPAGPAAPTFCPRATFPPAHRPLQHQLQTMRALHDHIQESASFLEAMSDLHVLLFLATNEALPLPWDALAPLLAAVRARDAGAAAAWRAQPAPATLLQLAAAAGACEAPAARRAPPPRAAAGAAGAQPAAGAQDAPGALWTCAVCTFHNAARRAACEMCAMPRSDAM